MWVINWFWDVLSQLGEFNSLVVFRPAVEFLIYPLFRSVAQECQNPLLGIGQRGKDGLSFCYVVKELLNWGLDSLAHAEERQASHAAAHTSPKYVSFMINKLYIILYLFSI